MARIFISHSSANIAEAIAVHDWMKRKAGRMSSLIATRNAGWSLAIIGKQH
jgi:hypothetical protein